MEDFTRWLLNNTNWKSVTQPKKTCIPEAYIEKSGRATDKETARDFLDSMFSHLFFLDNNWELTNVDIRVWEIVKIRRVIDAFHNDSDRHWLLPETRSF